MTSSSFAAFNLADHLLRALSDLGYETPSLIQQKSIPLLLQDLDLIAQAQTGTGKTAAFALPILEKIELVKRGGPQALVLAPTRELAIQVAEAFQSYAKHLPGFHVMPIYGGQDYSKQLRALKKGVHVVVGTPGRIMDHMRRKSLTLNNIKTLVLDEADEMLKMGFLEDVEWILEHLPHEHQTALFSATMLDSIKKMAHKYLVAPAQVKIKTKTLVAAGIAQSAMVVSSKHKLEALTRYLEIEDFDGMIIFSRTKTMTAELAEKLSARGYATAALNGDMSQNLREQVIDKVKRNAIDIIIATDVAARGLDVKRLSHVVNFDAPYDVETYVHRIGRTGRAGKAGKSLLMITPREKHYLRDIEKMTKQSIDLIAPPTTKELRKTRIDALTHQILTVLEHEKLDYYRELIGNIAHHSEQSELDIAAALLQMAQKDKPLLLKDDNRSFIDPADVKAKSKSKSSKRSAHSKKKFYKPKNHKEQNFKRRKRRKKKAQ